VNSNEVTDELTVVLCTHNRADDLRTTLDALDRVPCYEVIVVDNASTDHTADVLAERPGVRVVRHQANVGVPGFGSGVAASRTPYALLLDDDAIPDPDVPRKLVSTFREQPDVAAIACQVVTPDGTVVTKDWPEQPVLFWGCGAGVRRAAVLGQGPMYYPKLRLHGTELDLCIRLYSRGHLVAYDQTARIVHRFSETNRSRERRVRTVTYASIRFAWDHLSWRSAIRASARAARSGRVDSPKAFKGWLLGLFDILVDLPDIARRRCVVPRIVEDAYMNAVWEYQPRGAPRVPLGFPAADR
jgi:GT2 family glycosyltransferase